MSVRPSHNLPTRLALPIDQFWSIGPHAAIPF